MPVLSSVVPVYTTTTVSSGDSRSFSTVSPGGTDSTSTSAQFVSAAAAGYWKPEQANTDTSPLLGVGVAYGRGWAATAVTDNLVFAAGNWVLEVHYSRAGSLTVQNITQNNTVILFIISSLSPLVVRAEIGRQTQSITHTTTEQSITYTIAASSVRFENGDRLYMEMHADKAATLLGATCRIHTNSTSATRITAIPNYTIFREGVAQTTGTGTDSWKAAGVGSGVFAATGVATDSWKETGIGNMVYTASGIAVPEAVGARILATVFDSVGVATTDAVGSATFSGVFTGTGEASDSWVVGGIGSCVFDAQGVATGDVVSGSLAGSVFSGSGAASDSWVAGSVWSAVFTADGVATDSFIGNSIFSGVFNATGEGIGSTVATAIFSGVFDATGVATEDFKASSLSGTVFSASGIATSSWFQTNIQAGVFTSDVGGGGGDTFVYPIFAVLD